MWIRTRFSVKLSPNMRCPPCCVETWVWCLPLLLEIRSSSSGCLVHQRWHGGFASLGSSMFNSLALSVTPLTLAPLIPTSTILLFPRDMLVLSVATPTGTSYSPLQKASPLPRETGSLRRTTSLSDAPPT